jgi:hypothetical protein
MIYDHGLEDILFISEIFAKLLLLKFDTKSGRCKRRRSGRQSWRWRCRCIYINTQTHSVAVGCGM